VPRVIALFVELVLVDLSKTLPVKNSGARVSLLFLLCMYILLGGFILFVLSTLSPMTYDVLLFRSVG